MANNSLNSERTNHEKLAALEAAQRRGSAEKKEVAVPFVTLILMTIIAGAIALYAMATREAVGLFKLSLILEIIVAIVTIVLTCKISPKRKANGGIVAICVIAAIAHCLAAFFMITSGRFKIEEVITTNDGYVLEMIDGEYYIYSCNTKDDEVVISELPHNVVGFSSDFQGSNYLTSVVIDVDRFELGKNAFSKCTNLTTVIFEGDGDYVIRSKAFNNCKIGRAHV